MDRVPGHNPEDPDADPVSTEHEIGSIPAPGPDGPSEPSETPVAGDPRRDSPVNRDEE